MKEIQTDKGILKYRMPNVLEAYDLLDASGVNDPAKPSNLKLKRNIIMAMSDLIDVSDIEGVSTYSELLEDVDTMAAPLSQIADEVIARAFGAFKKKT